MGYIAGKKVAEDVVNTPGKAVGLKLWLDESGRKPQAGCNDVLFLYIAAVDANGTVVPDFAETIRITSYNVCYTKLLRSAAWRRRKWN